LCGIAFPGQEDDDNAMSMQCVMGMYEGCVCCEEKCLEFIGLLIDLDVKIWTGGQKQGTGESRIHNLHGMVGGRALEEMAYG